MSTQHGIAGAGTMESPFRLLGGARAGCVVRAHEINHAITQAFPEGNAMARRPDRRNHLEEKAVWVITRQTQVWTRRLHCHPATRSFEVVGHLQAFRTGEMYNIQMDARDTSEVTGRLNGQRLSVRRMGTFPVSHGSFRLFRSQPKARTLDERRVLRMDASHGVQPQSGDGAKGLE